MKKYCMKFFGMLKGCQEIFVILLFSSFVVVTPISVSAQDHLEYGPTEWNFGEVEVGSSATAIFTLTNVNGGEVLVSRVEWVYDSTSCVSAFDCDPFFTRTVPLNAPITIPSDPDLPPASYDLPVQFSPSSPGTYSAILHVSTNANNAYDIYFNISGEGVLEEEPPNELIAELIYYFDSCVNDGSVFGSGPGAAASGRLKAFANMLNASSDLISAGEYDSACAQLYDVLDRIDGEDRPPDFVIDTSGELISMIQDLLNKLGCP